MVTGNKLVSNKQELLGLLLRAAQPSGPFQATTTQPWRRTSKPTARAGTFNEVPKGIAVIPESTQQDVAKVAGALHPLRSYTPADGPGMQPESSLHMLEGRVAPQGHARQQHQADAEQTQQDTWLKGVLVVPTADVQGVHHAPAGLVRTGSSVRQPAELRTEVASKAAGGKMASKAAGVSKPKHQQKGHSRQFSSWTRPGRGSTRKGEVVDLLNKVVEIPGHVFGVDNPDVYFKARVIAPDTAHAQAAVIKMIDNKARYYFPVGQVREWLHEQQEREWLQEAQQQHADQPLNRQPSTASDMSDLLAAQVLALLSGDANF